MFSEYVSRKKSNSKPSLGSLVSMVNVPVPVSFTSNGLIVVTSLINVRCFKLEEIDTSLSVIGPEKSAVPSLTIVTLMSVVVFGFTTPGLTLWKVSLGLAVMLI